MRKEGKERVKVKGTIDISHMASHLTYLFLSAFWKSNSVIGQKTDPCLFCLSDSPLQLCSSLCIQFSFSFSDGLSSFLGFFSFSPSVSLWRTIGLIQYEELEANQTMLRKWVWGGKGRMRCKGNWNWLALNVRMPIEISVILYRKWKLL